MNQMILDAWTHFRRSRLSGWARLWIVILVPVWLVSVGFEVSNEQARWQFVSGWRSAPLAPEELVRRIDPQTGEVWHRDSAGKHIVFPPNTPAANVTKAMEKREQEIRAERRQEPIKHLWNLLSAIVNPTIGVIGTFALAMLGRGEELTI
jgi:hypothetical protein